MNKMFHLIIALLSMHPLIAATYEWRAMTNIQFFEDTDDARIWLVGSITKKWTGIADADGQGLMYYDDGSLYLKQYDRKTTPIGDDNVTFVLALYGDLLAADTIEAATKVPLCTWDTYEHSGGIVIDDPSDFYLGFMTPESKTADGVIRYGWYHLSIADDLNDITLLDSGVGLYGESIVVGIGATPEPTTAMLLLLGCAGLLLRRGKRRECLLARRPFVYNVKEIKDK